MSKRKKLPIKRTVNGFTPEYERMILRETAEAEKNGKRFKTVEESMKDLND